MSNFRKRNVQKPLPGTKTSVQTGQVITSSGNPSLDVILGGGLPIGSICLIEEDKFTTHSKVLAKYFLAEGVLWQQSIFLGSLDDKPEELLRKLPRPLDEQEIEKENAEAAGDGAPKNGLRIAWRYENLPLVNSEQSTAKIGHHFNLMEHMDPHFLDWTETVTWSERKLRAASVNNENYEEQDTSAEDVNNFEFSTLPKQEKSTAEQHLENENEQEMAATQSLSDGGGDAADLSSNLNEPTELLQHQPTQPHEQNDDNSHNNLLSSTSGDIELVPKSEETTTSEESTTTTGEADTSPTKPKIFHNIKFQQLWARLHTLLRESKFNDVGPLNQSRILSRVACLCRVCLTSLGSPLWYDEEFGNDLLKFLTLLRFTVRSQTSVCLITMPMHLIAKYDATLVPKIRNLVDYSIELDSFAGTLRETHPAFKEYSGLLHIHKMTAINTLTAYMPETCDLAFKLRRKKFVIEKLHLPPELQEANSEQDAEQNPSADIMPMLSCSAAGGNKNKMNSKASLDF